MNYSWLKQPVAIVCWITLASSHPNLWETFCQVLSSLLDEAESRSKGKAREMAFPVSEAVMIDGCQWCQCPMAEIFPRGQTSWWGSCATGTSQGSREEALGGWGPQGMKITKLSSNEGLCSDEPILINFETSLFGASRGSTQSWLPNFEKHVGSLTDQSVSWNALGLA